MKKVVTFVIALALSICTGVTAFAETGSTVYFDSGFTYRHMVSMNFPWDGNITSSTEKSVVTLFSPYPVAQISSTPHFKATHPNSNNSPSSSVQNQNSTSDRDRWITVFRICAVDANGLTDPGETCAPENMTVTLTDNSMMDIPCTLELTNIPSIFWRDAETGAIYQGGPGEVGVEKSFQACIRDRAGLYDSFSIEWEHRSGSADIVSVIGAPGSSTDGMRTSGIVPPVKGEEFVGSTITVVPHIAGGRVDIVSRLYDPDGNGLYPFWGVGFRVEGTISDFTDLSDVKSSIESGAPVSVPVNTGLSASNVAELKQALESGTLTHSQVTLTSQQDDGFNLQMSFDLNDPAFDSSKVKTPFTPAYTAAMPEAAKGDGIPQVGSQWIQFSYFGEPPAPITVTLDIDPDSALGTASQIIIWRYNGVGNMELVTSAATQKNAQGKNIKATFVLSHFSTYALYQEGIDPNPSRNGGYSGGSGKSSKETVSRLLQDKLTIKNQATGKELGAKEAEKLAQTAVAQAKAAGKTQGVVRLTNVTTLSKEVLAAIAQVQTAQNGKLMIHADTLVDGTVTARIAIDPASTTLATPFATGVRVGHPATEAVFGKYFRNRIAVLELAQPSALGADVRIAAKVDVSQWDVAKMKLYSYDRVSNSYSLLKNGNFFADENHYLHFTTNMGGILVVSEGLLTRE